MNIISTLQSTYGKVYGLLVFAASIFFMVIGAIWFGRMLFWAKSFHMPSFLLMTAFMVQLIYHKKLAPLVSGIITLFFSLWLLMQVSTNKEGLKGVYSVGLILSIIAIISSGILIFSFLQAHKEESRKS